MEPPATTPNVAKTAFNMLLNRATRGDTTRPEDSSAPIPAFDNQIHSFEALLASLVTEANNHLAILKQSRNTLAPIHVLPDEVLVKIWLFCIQDAPKVSDLLQTLALVCKSWHQSVLNQPALWCYLQDTSKARRYNNWAFQKSQNYPLHLHLASKNLDSSYSLIKMALPESRRWKSFTLVTEYGFESPAADPLINMLADANLEKLTSLELRAKTYWGQVGPIGLPAAPALREVRLERSPLRWETFQAPQLRALRIHGHSTYTPSLSEFLDLLRSTPLLEILLLKDFNYNSTDQNSPVHLPRLRALYLSLPTSTNLLRLIRAENLRQLLGRAVSFDLWGPPRCPILDNMESLIPPTGKVGLFYYKEVHIATDPHPFHPAQWPFHDEDLTTPGFTFTSFKGAEMGNFLNTARWLSSLGTQTLVKVDLRNPLWSRFDFREIPVALLDHLPNLSALVIREGINVDKLFAELGRPKREPSGRLHWPWPHLIDLDLRDSDIVSSKVLFNLAQSRWGIDSIPQSTPVELIERPAKLKSLATGYTFPLGIRKKLEPWALEVRPDQSS
ncbi:hypothetical protein FRC01_000077 [Tulasnella sp. 417]|nr:hypothetical protein FRC01_000077 [Tulasnella sp. 417]